MLYLRIVDSVTPCYMFVTEYTTNSVTGEEVAIGYEDGEYEIPYELMARYNTIMKDFDDLQDALHEVYNNE